MEKIFIIFVDSFDDYDVQKLKLFIAPLSAMKVRIIIVGFRGYVKTSAVRELLGSGRDPVFVRDRKQLTGNFVISQVLGQMKRGN